MFQPVIPMAGLAGWRFLQRTYDAQFEVFGKSSTLQRDTAYFAEKISGVTSAEQLVSDRRLLGVALGAFGLQDDINNRYFIQKVLQEGTASNDALAVRLSDPRYRALSDVFGFGPADAPRVAEPGFAEDIVNRYRQGNFEAATGNQSNAMRIALYAERVLPELAVREVSTDTKWFTIMGDPPMRSLFEKALNLPGSIGQLDIDQQLGIFKDKAADVFGSDDLAIFADSGVVQDAIDRFILRDQIENTGASLSGNAIALTLLQG